ncbi:hypothetical protein U0070_015315, partial [Myodes glareolus]
IALDDLERAWVQAGALPRPTRAPREPVARDRRLRLSPGPRAQRHGAGRDPARASAAYLARAPALPLRLRVLLAGRRLRFAAPIRCGARATAAAEGPAPLSRPRAPRPYAASAGPAPSALASGAAAARPLPSPGGGGDLARTRPSFPGRGSPRRRPHSAPRDQDNQGQRHLPSSDTAMEKPQISLWYIEDSCVGAFLLDAGWAYG